MWQPGTGVRIPGRQVWGTAAAVGEERVFRAPRVDVLVRAGLSGCAWLRLAAWLPVCDPDSYLLTQRGCFQRYSFPHFCL